MKTEIITTQKLTSKKIISLFVVGLFAGFGLYHFVKAVSNLF
jgi:hypothetical protein